MIPLPNDMPWSLFKRLNRGQKTTSHIVHRTGRFFISQHVSVRTCENDAGACFVTVSECNLRRVPGRTEVRRRLDKTSRACRHAWLEAGAAARRH